MSACGVPLPERVAGSLSSSGGESSGRPAVGGSTRQRWQRWQQQHDDDHDDDDDHEHNRDGHEPRSIVFHVSADPGDEDESTSLVSYESEDFDA